MVDKRTEIVKKLIKETGLTKKAFSEKVGIPPTTLQSMLNRGIGNATVDNVIKVCGGLGIKVDELEKMSKEKLDNGDLPQLNTKDKIDIQKELEKIYDNLSGDSGFAAFDGKSINEVDPDDKDALKSSLETTMKLAKRISKQKFTPKKYRK